MAPPAASSRPPASSAVRRRRRLRWVRGRRSPRRYDSPAPKRYGAPEQAMRCLRRPSPSALDSAGLAFAARVRAVFTGARTLLPSRPSASAFALGSEPILARRSPTPRLRSGASPLLRLRPASPSAASAAGAASTAPRITSAGFPFALFLSFGLVARAFVNSCSTLAMKAQLRLPDVNLVAVQARPSRSATSRVTFEPLPDPVAKFTVPAVIPAVADDELDFRCDTD